MTLKPEDLRLGNWVSYDDGNYQMSSISTEGEPGLNTIEYGYGVVGWEDLEPIPLTVEWLEKLGFVKNIECKRTLWKEGIHIYCWKTGHFSLKFRDYGDGCDEFARINFVHRLQNVFHAIMNEELEIS